MSTGAPEDLPGPASLDDLLRLPEEGRGYELVGGRLIEKQTGFRHGRAQARVGRHLGPYDRRFGEGDRPGGWWFLMEQLVRFTPHVLRPDVAGWRRDNLPEPPAEDETIVQTRPDWVCEIISPSNAGHDLVKKKRIHHQHRVPHYWIIDPRDDSLTVLRWSPDGFTEILLAQRGERVRAEPFEAVLLQVGVLFGENDEE